MKHLSYKRIVELSENITSATKEENNHLGHCSLCSKQISILTGLGRNLEETPKIEPLVSSVDIDELADTIFDKHYCPGKRAKLLPGYLVPSFVSAFAAVLLTLLIFGRFDLNDRYIESSEARATDKKLLTEEITVNTVKNLSSGTVLTSDRYFLEALSDAVVIEESKNYFTVKKGKVFFDIRSGGDFFVNLNNIALVKVLGTSFTVAVEQTVVSVRVTEGSVEIMDKEGGHVQRIVKGETRSVSARKIPQKVANMNTKKSAGAERGVVKREKANLSLSPEMEKLFQYERKDIKDVVNKMEPSADKKFSFKKDAALIEAEIRDLEFSLRFSSAPVGQLQQLFILLSERRHYGSIIHYWRVYSKEINSDGNPFLHEMHRYACEASINLYLYDNGICRKYRNIYPQGPDPDGMNDHLNMAW